MEIAKEGKMSTGKKNDFKPLPAGEYMLRMNRITNKVTAKGDKAISVGFEVVKKVGDTDANESKSKNRLVFEFLCLENANPQTVEITNEKINKILMAVGEAKGLEAIDYDISKLSKYLHRPFLGQLKVKAGTNGYPDSNAITSFKTI